MHKNVRFFTLVDCVALSPTTAISVIGSPWMWKGKCINTTHLIHRSFILFIQSQRIAGTVFSHTFDSVLLHRSREHESLHTLIDC